MAPDTLLPAAGDEWDPGSALRHPGGERPLWNHLRGLQVLRVLWGEQLRALLCCSVLMSYIHTSR